MIFSSFLINLLNEYKDAEKIKGKSEVHGTETEYEKELPNTIILSIALLHIRGRINT